MTKATPVLIAGGGIGGLTAAIALDREGIPTRVLERGSFVEESGAGIQLGPNATRILEPLGILEALKPKTFGPAAIGLFDGLTGEQLTVVPLGERAEGRYGAPYVTSHRADLHAALREVAADSPKIKLTAGFAAETFSDDGDVQVMSGTGETVQGAALIGADGLWSTVRARLAPDIRPAFTGATAFRALLPREGLPAPFDEPAVGLWLGPRAHMVHYPVRGGDALNIVAVAEGGHEEQGWSRSVERDDVLKNFSRWSDVPLRLLDAVSSWRAWSLQSLPSLPKWHQGNVCLLGDAAHPVLPYLAQGAGLAIEDAATLAKLMAANRAEPALAFPAYQTIREPRALELQQRSKRLGRAYHMGDAFLGNVFRMARNTILKLRSENATLRSFDWLYGKTP